MTGRYMDLAHCRAVFRVRMSVLMLLALAALARPAKAQMSPSSEDDRKQAIDLFHQGRMEDALPLLEELTIAYPKDAGVREALGGALLAHAANLSDPVARRQTRLRARQAFLQAQALGNNSNYVMVELEGIPEDGSETPFSTRKDVDEAMRGAEAAYGRGDFAAALAGYAQVLKLDPRNYHAALFIGDVYYAQKDYDNSYPWFAKAVEIDPDQETAYRYWGDALYATGHNAEARGKYIEAIVASPYQRTSWVGLLQWAQRNRVALAQPKIESPNAMATTGDKTSITIDASILGKNDGSESWLTYEISRTNWREHEFQKQFPNEKEYRHSLAEEAHALGVVADVASEEVASKKIVNAQLNPQLATLIKLKTEGLLESYILLARADQGIAQDYAAYRKDHRDKLIQYMNEFVVPPMK